MYSGFTDGSIDSLLLQSSKTPPSTGATIHVSNAAELTAALKSAKGGETILLKAGTYDPVALKGIMPGSNVTIASADPANQAVLTGLVFRDSANITVRNLDLFDKDPATTSDFRIQNGTNISFDHVKVYSLEGDAGHSAQPFIVRDSTNVSISNSEFTNARYGISLLNNNGITIDNNYFHELRTDGVRAGGNSNVTITDNYFTDFRPANGDHADAIQFWTTNTTTSAKNILISGNAIVRGEGGAIQGIFMNDETGKLPYQNVVIENNLAVGTLYHGIKVAAAANLSVTGNTVAGMPGQLSWISVPAGTTLAENGAERFQIGGASVDFPAGNEMLPPSRDGGLNLISGWIGGDATKLMPVDSKPAPIPILTIEGTAGADTLRAAKAEDSILRGGAGNDKLYGQVAQAGVQTTLDGGTGDDTYFIYTDRDVVLELADGGNDTVQTSVDYTLTANVENLRMQVGGLTGRGNELDNKLIGSAGADTLYGEGGDDSIQGLDGNDWLYGGEGNDRLSGDAGDDYLFGGNGDDNLAGGEGDDWLDGGAGDDRFEGGAGADWMTGGTGADTFLFRKADLGWTDTITDFERGTDILSLSLIDANAHTDKNDAFKFVGTKGFTKTAGELRYTVTTDGVLVEGDVDGNGIADLSIKLLGINSVSAGDFVL